MKKFIVRVLNKLKLLRFLNLTYTIKLNSNKIIVPLQGNIGFNNLSVSEVWMIDVLTFLDLNTQDVFMDVGVNVGQTLMKFKTVYPTMDYVGFEPNVSCVHYVESLIEKNKWQHIDIIPSGISDVTGLGILEHYADDITDSSASIVRDYREGSTVYKRDIVTLLDVTSVESIWENKRVSAIKIDVEGAELSVLRSLQHIIRRDRPYLLVEILPVYDMKNKERLDNQTAIEEILTDLGYLLYQIHKDNKNSLKAIKRIESIGIHSDLDMCDYIFSPQELTLI